MRGNDVVKLQDALKQLGYVINDENGLYWYDTKNAVWSIQEKHNSSLPLNSKNKIKVDGKFGKDTCKIINTYKIYDASKEYEEYQKNEQLQKELEYKKNLAESCKSEIQNMLLNKMNLDASTLSEQDMQMLLWGIGFGIDDNVSFGISQWVTDKKPVENNYYFMKAKTFTDAVFLANYLNVSATSAANAARALANSGAAAAFAFATSETGFGSIGGGAVALEELTRASVTGLVSLTTAGMSKRSASILKSDVEKLKAAPKPRSVLIRNVSKDILDKMERLGGHTLKKHVGVSNQDLIKRSIKEDLEATSFIDKDKAVRTIQENLRNNAKEIEKWLSDSSAKNSITYECQHAFNIGKGAEKNSKNITYGLNQSRIVLEKNNLSELGFIIKTAFPIFN